MYLQQIMLGIRRWYRNQTIQYKALIWTVLLLTIPCAYSIHWFNTDYMTSRAQFLEERLGNSSFPVNVDYGDVEPGLIRSMVNNARLVNKDQVIVDHEAKIFRTIDLRDLPVFDRDMLLNDWRYGLYLYQGRTRCLALYNLEHERALYLDISVDFPEVADAHLFDSFAIKDVHYARDIKTATLEYRLESPPYPWFIIAFIMLSGYLTAFMIGKVVQFVAWIGASIYIRFIR